MRQYPHKKLIVIASIASLAVIALSGFTGFRWGAPRIVALQDRPFEDARAGSVLREDARCRSAVLNSLPRNKADAELSRCSEVREVHRMAINDLIQQTRAADAAVAQADLAAQTAWLSYVQTLFGMATGLVAVAAAYFAWKAADAANKAVKDQLSTSKDNNRAWLCLDIIPTSDLVIKDGEVSLSIEVVSTNIGTRIARDVSGWASFYQGSDVKYFQGVLDDLRTTVDDVRARLTPNVRSALPGRSHIFRPPLSLGWEPKRSLRIIALVKYNAVGGAERFVWEAFIVGCNDAFGRFRTVNRADTTIALSNLIVRRLGFGDAD